MTNIIAIGSKGNNPPTKLPRLDGLDLARFIALIGMVIVNFTIVMGAEQASTGFFMAQIFTELSNALHGRAAALFVVLAGIGLGLAAKRERPAAQWRAFYRIHYKRAAFLLAVGLLNMLVFEADILHYYAFYFAFGLLCIRWPAWAIVSSIFALMVLFVTMVTVLNYDAGWDWDNYAYLGFWTGTGFVRNLFFNGWHPVVPWLAFLLWGILLARLDLYTAKTRLWILASHGLIFVTASCLSFWFSGLVSAYDPEAALLFTTDPLPPMPLYILAGGGAAGMVAALCLLIAPYLGRLGVLNWFTRPGRQTLTLYVAHIYVGMGTMEALGLLGEQRIETAMLASLLFSLAAIIYAWLWQMVFKRGPMESLMRKL